MKFHGEGESVQRTPQRGSMVSLREAVSEQEGGRANIRLPSSPSSALTHSSQTFPGVRSVRSVPGEQRHCFTRAPASAPCPEFSSYKRVKNTPWHMKHEPPRLRLPKIKGNPNASPLFSEDALAHSAQVPKVCNETCEVCWEPLINIPWACSN